MISLSLLSIPALLLTQVAGASTPQNIFLGTYSSSTEAGSMRTISWDGSALKQVASQPRAGNGSSWISFANLPSSNATLAYTVNDHASPTQHALHAYTLGGSGASDGAELVPLNVAKSGGWGTVHLSVSRFEGARCLYAANYGGESTSVLRLSKEGKILGSSLQFQYYKGSGPITDRQDQSRPHEIIDSPDGKFVYVPDLGADRVHILSLTDPSKCTLKPLAPLKVSPGDGPRHLTFHTTPNGTTLMHLVTELSGTLRTYSQDSTSGALTHLQTLSLRPALKNQPASVSAGIAPSEVIVTPDGTSLYVALRALPHPAAGSKPSADPKTYNEDLIVSYALDPITALPVRSSARYRSSGGRNPRHFSLDPTGQWLAVANQGDDGDETAKGAGLAILTLDKSNAGLPAKVAFLKASGAAVAMWGPVSASVQ